VYLTDFAYAAGSIDSLKVSGTAVACSSALRWFKRSSHSCANQRAMIAATVTGPTKEEILMCRRSIRPSDAALRGFWHFFGGLRDRADNVNSPCAVNHL
jgi:hypothetical protein